MGISAQSIATDSFSSLCKIDTHGPICPQSDCQFDNDVGKMLGSERLSDITLKVGKQIFQSQKVILAARIPVFAAKFQHEMLKKVENNVTCNQ